MAKYKTKIETADIETATETPEPVVQSEPIVPPTPTTLNRLDRLDRLERLAEQQAEGIRVINGTLGKIRQKLHKVARRG